MCTDELMRVTQRFISEGYVFRRHYPSQKFGINCEEKLDSVLFSQSSPQIFVTLKKLISFVWRDICIVQSAIKGHLAFSESQQQLVKPGNKILFLKIFCHLNFQLKNPNGSYGHW